MTAQNSLPPPPVAAQRPYSYERHGVRIEDPWHWLKDESYPVVDDPDVLAYLRAENAYYEAAMAPHRPLIDTLVRGDARPHPGGRQLGPGPRRRLSLLVGVQPRRAISHLVPAAASPAATAQIIFDEAAEAAGKQYFRLGAMQVSPDGRYAATLVDDNGSERFKLRIRDLATGHDVETVTEVGIGAPVWTADSRGHRLHRGQRALALLPRPAAPARPARRERPHALRGDREYRLHRRRRPHPGPALHPDLDRREQLERGPLRPRRQSRGAAGADRPRAGRMIQYSVDASHGKFWILTNDDHVNFRIAEADPAHPGDWHTVIAGSDAVYLRGVTAFRDHLAITERVNGLDQIRLRAYDGGERRIPFTEAAYTVGARRQSRICAGRLSARTTARWSRRRPSTIIIRPRTGSRR